MLQGGSAVQGRKTAEEFHCPQVHETFAALTLTRLTDDARVSNTCHETSNLSLCEVSSYSAESCGSRKNFGLALQCLCPNLSFFVFPDYSLHTASAPQRDLVFARSS